jgi:uncharacterized protein YbaR (Trm112 family)
MKKSMLDILACPIDKNYPLELIELTIKNLQKDNLKENEDSTNNKGNNDSKKKIQNDSELNHKNEIHDNVQVTVVIDGILFCRKCSRFYPIIDEIPIMLPDELRDKQKDLQFLKKWENYIPQLILKNSNPWHL